MKTLIYDDTMEGFLTSIFYCYETNEFNNKITSQSIMQSNLLDELVTIKTDKQKSKRVKTGIVKKAGTTIFNEVATVFCSSDKEKDNIIFEYLKLVFAFGRKARLMLNNKNVIAYNNLLKKVTYERHRMIGFIRFEETKEGVLYAKYSPDNNVTHLLLSHFANRLSTQSFIIHDITRNILGIYNKKENNFFTYTTNDKLSPITLNANESFFQKLWQNYYKDAAIMERKNTRCMLNYMPKRYHKHMTEFKA